MEMRRIGNEMNNHKTILITSCKGGVGKSTVTANLGFALAKRGLMTLMIDFDLGNRTLDLILGCENRVLYDFGDIACGRVEAGRVLLADPRSPNLFFCPAPAKYGDELDPDTVRFAFQQITATRPFDYILIDTSGGADQSVFLSAPLCEEVLIVTTQQPIAIRAAEKSGALLDGLGVGTQRLVINCFGSRPKGANHLSIIEIIDAARTPIIGVVPYAERLMFKQEQGILAGELSERAKDANVAVAFQNIAARLCGEQVPLFSNFKGVNRKKLMQY